MTNEGQFAEVPETAVEMVARWADRDAEYAKTRKSLPPEQAEAVRMMRMQEANRLPNIKERGRMFARAKAWEAPVHQDFGSLRDMLD